MIPDRPMVAAEIDLDIGEQLDDLIDAIAPLDGIAHLRTVKGVTVVHGVGHHFGHAEGLASEPHDALRSSVP
ncbi:MAG: hypothetical protein WBN38_09755 [Polyangiales bacterium]